MNIDDLTIGQVKQLTQFVSGQAQATTGLNSYGVGKKCIIRTYTAGVWFGEVIEKSGNEIILKNARRLWRWHAAESISLSAVAVYGINQDKSSIAPAVEGVWLEPIEIIPATDKAIKSIEGAKDAKAQ